MGVLGVCVSFSGRAGFLHPLFFSLFLPLGGGVVRPVVGRGVGWLSLAVALAVWRRR